MHAAVQMAVMQLTQQSCRLGGARSPAARTAALRPCTASRPQQSLRQAARHASRASMRSSALVVRAASAVAATPSKGASTGGQSLSRLQCVHEVSLHLCRDGSRPRYFTSRPYLPCAGFTVLTIQTVRGAETPATGCDADGC